MSNLNIPLIRFTQYSDSWNLRPLSELIASVDSGWSPQCDDGSASMGEWGVLKTTSIQWTGFEPNQNKKLPYALEPRAKLSLSKNDILVTRAGPNERVGVVSIVNQDYPMLMLSDKIIRLRANAEVDPRYLALNLSLKKSNYQIMRKASGLATSQTNISQGFLLQTKLNVPELPEQQKIASFLSKVDEKITLLTEKKAKLTEYKKGVMQQLFSGKWEDQNGQRTFIPPTLRFKADDGSEFPDWKEKTLGDVSESPSYGLNSAATKYDGLNKYIRITDIDEDDRSFSPSPLTSPEEIDDAYLLEEGDIVFARTGASVGKSYLYNKDDGRLMFAGFLIKFSVSKANPKFISYQMTTSQYDNWVKVMSVRSGQPGINAQEYLTYPLNVPCTEEQEQIANFLSALDYKIDLTRSELKKAKEWKKGLLQQMFV
ncbi:restriction endonuclease subunit S [Vibrio furnissii]|uniref:restriction endonuclease subunit S n=1 Tax=Vibrio furnissii TaxID=29494 RepID=UPI003747C1C3